MTAAQRRPYHLIRSLEAKALKKRSLTVRIADHLTAFFGSIPFFVINLSFFISWILINSGKVPGIPIFDPFPHILLTMAVSLEAIILTIIVLMSQNRQSFITSLRDEMDLQVDLFAEQEITKILTLLALIAQKQGIKLKDPELVEMLKKLDTSYIERKLADQLNPKQETLAEKVTEALHPLRSSDSQ